MRLYDKIAPSLLIVFRIALSVVLRTMSFFAGPEGPRLAVQDQIVRNEGRGTDF